MTNGNNFNTWRILFKQEIAGAVHLQYSTHWYNTTGSCLPKQKSQQLYCASMTLRYKSHEREIGSWSCDQSKQQITLGRISAFSIIIGVAFKYYCNQPQRLLWATLMNHRMFTKETLGQHWEGLMLLVLHGWLKECNKIFCNQSRFDSWFTMKIQKTLKRSAI